MGIYEQLGVKRVINCVSTTSPLGSSVTYPEVMEAMKEASSHYVVIDDLQQKVGKTIAQLTGSEAAIVTSGCDAALTLATAACMMKGTPLEKYSLSPSQPPEERGEWATWMQRLPDDTEGLKNELILQRGHITNYAQAFRVAGAKLTLVGAPEHCSPGEIERKINTRTAAIAFVGMYEQRGVPLEEVQRIARRHGVPIIMDAAYTLPPRSNLRHWASTGVDLVCYAGGKAIRGPSDTGILCGRKDLVNLAAIQMSPHHGIGRGFKVDKTQIVGLLKALEIFAGQNDEEELSLRAAKARFLVEELRKLPNVANVEQTIPSDGLLRGWPVVTLSLNERGSGIKAKDVVRFLYEGNPGVWTYYDNPLCPGGITMNTENLLDDEEELVVKRFKEILGG